MQKPGRLLIVHSRIHTANSYFARGGTDTDTQYDSGTVGIRLLRPYMYGGFGTLSSEATRLHDISWAALAPD